MSTDALASRCVLPDAAASCVFWAPDRRPTAASMVPDADLRSLAPPVRAVCGSPTSSRPAKGPSQPPRSPRPSRAPRTDPARNLKFVPGTDCSVRPAFYFLAATWPAIASVRFTLPARLLELDEDWARAWLEAEVARQEAEARAEVKAKGWRVPGPIAVQRVSPYKRARSWEDFGKRSPHIAAGRGETAARKAAIARLRKFRADYREAMDRWVGGDREVLFPSGTYWMRVHHGAAVAPFD